MSVTDSKGMLSKAAKDLFLRWEEAKQVWTDVQCQDFEKTFLIQIEQDVRSALSALDNLEQVLRRIASDCE